MTGGRTLGVAVIVLSTVAESVGQLAFKRATDAVPGALPHGAVVRALVNWRWLAMGIVGFTVDAGLWSLALKLLDVTVAHPIGSLVFVVTALFSRALLGERIPPRRWAGIGLILAGSGLVAIG